jgi:hypothetical protein
MKSTAVAPATKSTLILKGTLSYDRQLKQHRICGKLNYKNDKGCSPLTFELSRNLTEDEPDSTSLPKDGEFSGSFESASWQKQNTVIHESGVKIKFTKIVDNDASNYEYKVMGAGTNQFRSFTIRGTAKPTQTHDDDGQYIEFNYVNNTVLQWRRHLQLRICQNWII